jgi:ribonuclease Z
MHLILTSASTALFSTWVFVENLGLLFDAGDGVSATLLQKGRKIRHVFITHADRDHVCGLLQLHQLNASEGFPHIYYPQDCGTFPALRDFVKQFDPQSGPATWKGLKPGQIVELENGGSVVARASAHIASEGLTKALDFTLCRVRRVLRPEFRDLPGSEIAAKRKELGEEAISERKTEPWLGYSGDAPELDPKRWSGVKILLHESTFLEAETARRAHSNLPQVIAAASLLELEALILLHFSARYSSAEIDQAICHHAETCLPQFPIYAVYPGEVVPDILSKRPIWRPPNKT